MCIRDRVLSDPEQMKRSDYINKLRWRHVPEFLSKVFQKSIFSELEEIWHPNEVAEYKAMHRELGATRSMINWYRAIDPDQILKDGSLEKQIVIPTLFIWGTEDPVISEAVINRQNPYIDSTFVTLKLETGHALMQSKTDTILNAVMEHIGSNSALDSLDIQ